MSKENMIGGYGEWADGLLQDPPRLSLRNGTFKDIDAWRDQARKRVLELLMPPDTGGVPEADIITTWTMDGLVIEELEWQLPYGPPTRARFLKPENTEGPLPGILAFHDHGGNKYFGRDKITRTPEKQHPIMRMHQRKCYEDTAWANEIAARGYAVLVPDTFPFSSRRVLAEETAEAVRGAMQPISKYEGEAEINAYNEWAGQHENIMAKSLFYAGTTWPGVFLAEDRAALDYLCARQDVDAERIGCGGLSGGGMRTIFTGGMDDRIKCAVCVGLMSTHRDYILNKCFTHTWMMCVPGLAQELDYPELLGLRAPLATMVLNDNDDPLFTLPEMKRAGRILEEVFEKAGAADKFRCNFYPGPHKFDKAMQQDAFAWFDLALK